MDCVSKGSSVDGMGKGSSMNGVGKGSGMNSVGKGSSMNTVSKGSSMDGMGKGSSMDSVMNRGMDGVGNNGSVSNSMGNRSMSNRVGGSSFIGDLSNESKVIVSMVGGGLDSAIRKSNAVGSSNISISILGLSLLEVSSTVVIIHSILISKGLRGFIIGSRGILGGRDILG